MAIEIGRALDHIEYAIEARAEQLVEAEERGAKWLREEIAGLLDLALTLQTHPATKPGAAPTTAAGTTATPPATAEPATPPAQPGDVPATAEPATPPAQPEDVPAAPGGMTHAPDEVPSQG